MSSYSELLALFNKCYETRKYTGITNCNHCYFSKYTKMSVNVISVVNRSYKDINNTEDLSLIREYMDKCEDDEMLIMTKNSIDKIKYNDKDFIDDILINYKDKDIIIIHHVKINLYNNLNIEYNEYLDDNLNESEEQFIKLNNIKRYGEIWFLNVNNKPHYQFNCTLTIQSMYIDLSWLISEYLDLDDGNDPTPSLRRIKFI